MLVKYKGNSLDITIPDSVSMIQDGVFRSLKIHSVSMPDSVEEIGSYAFYDCSALTSIKMSNNITRIGAKAFTGCANLKSITISPSISSIGDYAFHNCSSLQSIKIAGGKIGSKAFADCTSLKSVVICYGVTSIGKEAFQGCISLSAIEVPGSISEFPSRIFSNCIALSMVTLSTGLTNIGPYAFEGTAIEEIDLPNTIQTIQRGAFNCQLLKRISFSQPPTSEVTFEVSEMPNLEDFDVQSGLYTTFIDCDSPLEEYNGNSPRYFEECKSEKLKNIPWTNEEEMNYNRVKDIHERWKQEGVCLRCGGHYKGLTDKNKRCKKCGELKADTEKIYQNPDFLRREVRKMLDEKR